MTMDEAALLLELDDVYWTEEGLLSVQIGAGLVGLLGALAIGLRFLQRGEERVLPACRCWASRDRHRAAARALIDRRGREEEEPDLERDRRHRRPRRPGSARAWSVTGLSPGKRLALGGHPAVVTPLAAGRRRRRGRRRADDDAERSSRARTLMAASAANTTERGLGSIVSDAAAVRLQPRTDPKRQQRAAPVQTSQRRAAAIRRSQALSAFHPSHTLLVSGYDVCICDVAAHACTPRASRQSSGDAAGPARRGRARVRRAAASSALRSRRSAAEAGFTRGALLLELRSKEELFAELLQQRVSRDLPDDGGARAAHGAADLA